MNFKYTGVFVAVLILLGMLITCHLRNYFYFNQSTTPPKSAFINLKLAVPTGTPPLKYNQIDYVPGIQKIPCEIASQGRFPCHEIQTCLAAPQTTQAEQLSDSELAVLYKEAYEQAGLEIMKRALRK